MHRMTKERKREINQLWFLAKHYFGSSRRLRNRLPRTVLSATIKNIADNYCKQKDFVGDVRRAMLMTAHLASCAIRLDTIEDVFRKSNMTSKRLRDYEAMRKNGSLTQCQLKAKAKSIIHFLLRNNVAHLEPHGKDKNRPAHNEMEKYLKSLTVQEIYANMEFLIEEMRKDKNISTII